MSAARFKSRDDYFNKKSGLAKKVIELKQIENNGRLSFPNTQSKLLHDVFCRTVEKFEIEGKGSFDVSEHPLGDILAQHISGEETVYVNPLSRYGKTSWNVVRFSISENMDHPFTKAKQFSDKLLEFKIKSLLEVTEGGKGNYHVWIFHEDVVDGLSVAAAINMLGNKLFGADPDMIPTLNGDGLIALPLQGESILFQRRVFVNTVGKMIKDQFKLLESIEYTTMDTITAFMKENHAGVGVKSSVITSVCDEEKKLTKKDTDRPVTEKITKNTENQKIQKMSEKSDISAITAASQMEVKTPLTPAIGLLVVKIGEIEYGITSDSVEAITRLNDVRIIPDTATALYGILYWKGRNLPVIDTGILLGNPKVVTTSKSRILIVKNHYGMTGLLIDTVTLIITSPYSKKTISQTHMKFISSEITFQNRKETLLCFDIDIIIRHAGTLISDNKELLQKPEEKYVIVSISGIDFGIPAERVIEIVPVSYSHPLVSKNSTQSMIQYRKKFIPLVFLEKSLGIHIEMSSERTKKVRILIISGEKGLVGIRVERVNGIQSISIDSIDSPPDVVRHSTPIKGFARVNGNNNVIIIVDVEKMKHNEKNALVSS
ncbi:MAG: chemotaxis protein CheW [Candidatus Latescibacteria bacterium]|nr:chemotaxis protein CheW [Candidatus Latescibacterota bacterium]